ncbi:MAG: S9 family peptidase [Calditrichaeota bacterium]|nr:MAG: S9 family peptidase [Calditrichota bacterium]
MAGVYMYHLKLFAIISVVVLGISCIQKRPPEPPSAKKDPVTHNLHGKTWEDDYDWLKNRDSEEVLKYLNAENRYTEEMTSEYEVLQTKIYNEIMSRIDETDESVPEKNGKYYYYEREEEGKEYKIYCRKKNLDDEEEIILDVNELAIGYNFYSVDLFEVSPNGEMLAYAVDTTGREEYTLHFKDLDSGKILKDKVTHCYASMVWGDDNKTLFYTVMDETLRPFAVYRHKIDSKTEDELVFKEDDGKFWVELSSSKSQKYIFIEIASALTTEVWYLEADKEEDDFQLFQKRIFEHEYSVYHHDDDFYIVTNTGGATNFKIMKTDKDKTTINNWVELFPYDESVKIESLDIFEDYLVVYERRDGMEKVRVVDLEDMIQHSIKFDEEVYMYSTWSNYEYDSEVVRVTYSSPITPKTVIDYNMETKEQIVQKVYEVPNYDKSLYETTMMYADANDGVKVPMTLFYRKGLDLNGNNPVYLYGYGSYGDVIEPRFRSHSFSLLDRGFVFALAHVRGGGEMGRTWYEDGKFLNKKNTFTDFIVCAEKLVEERYTSYEKIAITGGSAGGLLIGAVLNMRPDICQVAVADVRLVDVRNTLIDLVIVVALLVSVV